MTRVPSWCLKTCQRNWKYGDLLWQQWDYPIMDKAGLDLTLGRLGKNVARPEISYVQLLDNESFPETSTQQLPSQTCWSLECSYKGNDQVFLCLTIGYNKIIMIWLASYSDQRIGFITREKGLKRRRGEDGRSEFRDLRPPEGDRMQLPGVSSRCWRPWSMSSGLFALNMWRRCTSWENPVFVADRAWDLATLLWHITQ